MIREFSIHAKSTNNKARIIFFVCFILSFVLLTVSNVVSHYGGVIGLFGLSLLAFSVMLFTKYISAVYYYDVLNDSEGLPLLVIRQVTGKRGTTLCRIALYEIVKVELESAAERKKHKTPASVKKYNYVPTVFPDKTCRIYTTGRHERAEIIIEVSEEIAGLLSEYAAEARETQAMLVDEEDY